MTDKKSFLLFNDLKEPIKSLSDEDAGKLFKTILEYQNGGIIQEPEGTAGVAFTFIKQQIDRSSEHYETICERNRINGTKGGRPKNPVEPKEPSGLSGNPVEPKITLPNPHPSPKSDKEDKDVVITAKQQEQKDKEKELGKKAKACLDYYFQKHTEVRNFGPMIAGGRDMAIFKRILKADYTVEAVKEVIDFFFEYKQRTKFSTRDLYNSFDTLYGVLLDKAEGRRT